MRLLRERGRVLKGVLAETKTNTTQSTPHNQIFYSNHPQKSLLLLDLANDIICPSFSNHLNLTNL
jgi:hypothetical protein